MREWLDMLVGSKMTVTVVPACELTEVDTTDKLGEQIKKSLILQINKLFRQTPTDWALDPTSHQGSGIHRIYSRFRHACPGRLAARGVSTIPAAGGLCWTRILGKS